MGGKMWRFAQVLVSALCGTLFGLAIATAVVVLIATQFFNFHIVSVESGSMAPDIHKGDLAVIRPAKMPQIHEGDVIFFRDKGGPPTLHRVVAIDTLVQRNVDKQGKEIGRITSFQAHTKGDANPANDAGVVTGDQLVGKEAFTIPTFGLLGSGVNTQALFFIIAGVIGVLWVIWEVATRIWRRGPRDGHAGPPETGPADDWSPESGFRNIAAGAGRDDTQPPALSTQHSPPPEHNA